MVKIVAKIADDFIIISYAPNCSGENMFLKYGSKANGKIAATKVEKTSFKMLL